MEKTRQKKYVFRYIQYRPSQVDKHIICSVLSPPTHVNYILLVVQLCRDCMNAVAAWLVFPGERVAKYSKWEEYRQMSAGF